jgi:CheY-like chemotaxis protein
MNIQPTAAHEQPLRVIALGEFRSDIAPPAPRSAALKVEIIFSVTLAQLPAALNLHDVLLTELAWLTRLTEAERDDLGRRAARWIVLAGVEANFENQIAWQRLGVSHFFPQTLDPERLATLLEDMHDRLHGPALRVVLLDDDAASLARHGAALADAGIDALTVLAPLPALQAMQQFKPDLLLLSIAPLGCGESDLIAIVRQQPKFARLPVIFIAAVEVMQQMLLTGTTSPEDFLIAPVAPELLIVAVKSHALRYRSTQRADLRRRQQEAWATARLEQLRVAIDEHAIISIADVRGDILHVNDRFCAISALRGDARLWQGWHRADNRSMGAKRPSGRCAVGQTWLARVSESENVILRSRIAVVSQ